MYSFTPQRNNRSSVIVPLVLFCAALVCFVIAAIGIGWRIIWQAIMIVSLVSGIQIIVRYMLTTYTYIVDEKADVLIEDELNAVRETWNDSSGLWIKIVCTQGKNSRPVAGFPISAIAEIRKKGEAFSDGNFRRAYNFNNNVISSSAYSMIIVLNGERMKVTFEPDNNILMMIGAKT